MSETTLLERLLNAFRCLPGVGRKTASRMVFHLLERDREGAKYLAQTLLQAIDTITHCQLCRNFTEEQICRLCAHPGRDDNLLCVVETPSDVEMLERSGLFQGRYFVLGGRLSPLDGIGPEELGLSELAARVDTLKPREVILALSATVEGEATCHYIATMLKPAGVRLSRIAQGVPVGGQLDYVDGHTLARALASRTEYEG